MREIFHQPPYVLRLIKGQAQLFEIFFSIFRKGRVVGKLTPLVYDPPQNKEINLPVTRLPRLTRECAVSISRHRL